MGMLKCTNCQWQVGEVAAFHLDARGNVDLKTENPFICHLTPTKQ